jgi:hypothetical protein
MLTCAIVLAGWPAFFGLQVAADRALGFPLRRAMIEAGK